MPPKEELWIDNHENGSEHKDTNDHTYTQSIFESLQRPETLSKYTEKLEKEISQVISEIFSIEEISNDLWLKWGIISKIYWLDRPSTDIDINIINLANEKAIAQRVKDFLQEKGEIKKELIWDLLYRWVLYIPDEDTYIHIKIDLNKLNRKSDKYDFIEINWVKVRSMTKDCVFANKLVALSERFKDTDLYDVNFFLKNNFPISKDIIIERTGKELEDFITDLINELQAYYPGTLIAWMSKPFQDRQRKWDDNMQLMKETISLLENLKDSLK